MVTAVVGANWGDEGKGKITDMLADEADIVIRFQGGANAGHTIVNNYGKFALHTLPSGVFHSHITNIIGNGVALDIPKVISEIKSITDRNVPAPKIMISDRAQIVMPYHVLFDQYEEERLGKNSFGSTKSGIAPFYSDKYAKIGFQVSELFDEELLQAKIKRTCETKNIMLEHMYHKPLLKEEELLATLHEYRDMVAPYVGDVSLFLDKAIKEGKKILLEGQLGTLKDPDHGIYPMVTSSSTLAAYGAIGAGIPPYEIKKIVTVSKAYSSAVGAGAFVSEIFGDEADELRRRGGDGGEFGATTGRPRRMGWYDCVASKYGCRLQGTTDVALTVLDVLGYLDEIPVCVGYDIDGEVTTDFPVTAKLEKAKPVFKKLPGWKCDIRGIKKYEDLPENCRNYIEFVEEQIGYPITMVSNGPGREDIIYRNNKKTEAGVQCTLPFVTKQGGFMVKNIILDVGKVLVAWEPEDAMKQLGFDDKTVKAVADATVNTPVWLETDRGVWSDEQILQAFYEKAPEYKKEIDLFWNHLELAIKQFSYTKEWISNMKKEGLHVYILSNYGDWTYRRTKDNALDFLPLTDGAIFSYTVKQIKPDFEIYETLLNQYRLKPDECVFIDDRMENIEGAEKAGIHGICFETIGQVKEDLKKYNIYV